jgi:hypothetical protein
LRFIDTTGLDDVPAKPYDFGFTDSVDVRGGDLINEGFNCRLQAELCDFWANGPGLDEPSKEREDAPGGGGDAPGQSGGARVTTTTTVVLPDGREVAVPASPINELLFSVGEFGAAGLNGAAIVSLPNFALVGVTLIPAGSGVTGLSNWFANGIPGWGLLFERSTGLLNRRNDWFRIGYGWNDHKQSEVFRIAIGSKRGPIHVHFDLWRR